VNRREVLTGMALASAAVAVPATVMAGSLPASRAAWDRAMASLMRANAAHDAFDAPYWRIEEAYQAAVNAVPHVTIDGGGYGRALTTADRDVVQWARRDIASVRYVEACAYADVKASQQLVDATDARDAQIKAIEQRLGRNAANDHFDALSEAIGDAEEVLLKMPAPDGEALLWKVSRLYAEGQGIWEAGYESQTHADLRRLLTSNAKARS
jgi:hypothetical protein